MNLESAGQGPMLDVELEDGEICDDDSEERSTARRGDGSGNRPGGAAAVLPRGPRPPYMSHPPPDLRHPPPDLRHPPPDLRHPPPDLRHMVPYDVHGPSNHRQQCGPSGPDRPHAAPPLPHSLPPGPPLGLNPLCGGSVPRPSFWERSHGALWRFRHRSVPNGGRGPWNREGWAGHRPPMARYGPAENMNNRKESPGRKQKLFGRNLARRAPPSHAKCDGAESFEDLLSKYKQIQLELECIRKEESMALEAEVVQGTEAKGQMAEAVAGQRTEGCPVDALVLPQVSVQVPVESKKSFQAFNIKPLRLKLFTPASLDTSVEEAQPQQEEKDAARSDGEAKEAVEADEAPTCQHEEAKDGEKTPGRASSASSEDVFICLDELGGQVEEEDLSELQLRLLALQSASRKWQQKERQVMKRSRETTKPDGKTGPRSKPQDRERDKVKPGSREQPKATAKPTARTPVDRSRPKKSSGSASAGRQALRKRQLRSRELQRQREEDERHKREEEIRRIRDLSNQDEQYKRFMKLVGGKTHSCAKARDGEGRKSAGRTGQDSTGNLYQYDNYDEVAMETDSEPGSPARLTLAAQGSASLTATQLYGTPFCAAPTPPQFPLPPGDQALPPKLALADEEEEEMLLRETCLMSMANKRVVTAEQDPLWSTPPSPSAAPPMEQPSRGNLSAVSLNTMTAPRGNKFARGGASKATLVLPRHKSVVVSLNGSDDSDSDLDSAQPQGMFGGLEFMIKEARRTAEVNATKSKGAAATSEKENNPLRTPEALPEAKKAEYRLLREELASREKQKASAHDARQVNVIDLGAAALLSEVEQKLLKQRELLVRDEALLKNLLQQQLKKSESLKAAESKVARLREQMQASEKVVMANKILLKKIQEQVQRVEHRVSIKKSLAARLEQELLWTQRAAGGERKGGAFPKPLARKLQRVDAANHFAALMAQKQRLQRLESEYALRIQKLKEAQALRNKAALSEVPSERRPKPAALPDSKACLTGSPGPPQPSLHDLTQDILVLDSDDGPDPEAEEPEARDPEDAAPPGAASPRPRRRSFQCSNSTKPNLEQTTSTPVAKGLAFAKPAKNVPEVPTEACPAPGLDLEALRSRQCGQPGLAELLVDELVALGELHHVAEQDASKSAKVPPVCKETSKGAPWPTQPLPFGPYRSPLLVFKSYRFSPYYRTKEKLSLSSATYSNAIQPKRRFCRFDLTGTCNDDDCSWQHVRSCLLTGSLLFQDVLSYNLSLIGCSNNSSDSQVGAATGKYLSKLFGPHKDGMAVDQKAVFLVSKVNESCRHVPPFTTWKGKRKWRPAAAQSQRREERGNEEDAAGGEQTSLNSDVAVCWLDARVTSEDKRYFVSDTDDICKLESSVLENPGDTQLWIKLAFRYFHQGDTPPTECLEAALNTLSRALENNCDDPEVWTHYLTLFSRRGRHDEVEEMCQMAVEHAPHRRVWWNYLSLASTFEAKDAVCERLLNFLLGEACGGVSEERSFQLLEALLYRVHLNVFTGRSEAALAIFQNTFALTHSPVGVAGSLVAPHRALAWLAYIHLKEFGRLPATLYDPSESGPTRLVSAEGFLLPWRSTADITTPHEQLVGLFTDGIRQCSDESLSPSERTSACLPLHTNLLLLHRLLGRSEEGMSLCEALLEACPESCALHDALCELHVHSGNAAGAADSWRRALARCPGNAEVFYHCCCFLMGQGEQSTVAPLFREFVLSLCEEPCAQVTPIDLLRSILGLPTDDVRVSAIVRKDLQDGLLRQRSFLHLLHCRWHWLHGSAGDALDAFERALGSAAAAPRHQLHRLWTDYLQFCSVHAAQRLPDLILRCLGTVPARLGVPFDPTHFWTSYRFHNEVVALYLGCVDESQHAALLERLHYMMPTNIGLSLRLIRHECLEGNMEHVRFQAKMLTNSAPKCLPAWNIAIAAEAELSHPAEARRVVQQALQNLPLCAHLWKHLLQWEACVGGAGAAERAARVLSRGEEAGVTFAEPVATAQTDAV
ncbi:zinc finger C3H1 domain-containing protein-like isoform X4 [Syngnathus typhle]|uniref:zinc finger C3H1 domain-containing protein-like isoform X4 n=1 Tax=Syngnathus typhle TaxID=161592 RepID=UPI002A6AABE4|nr:zinc finger C3H1 domain-containing protein-like isoform X4 [Syngnathus typhle]XP_061138229.1 zinc finger C3H1 domain-containing protein-like isoform X4 [Syngnathus typhle]